MAATQSTLATASQVAYYLTRAAWPKRAMTGKLAKVFNSPATSSIPLCASVPRLEGELQWHETGAGLATSWLSQRLGLPSYRGLKLIRKIPQP